MHGLGSLNYKARLCIAKPQLVISACKTKSASRCGVLNNACILLISAFSKFFRNLIHKLLPLNSPNFTEDEIHCV